MNLPSQFKLAYSREEILARVKELAAEITSWAKEVRETTGKDVLGIPVLRGGLFFFADLAREIETSVGLAPVRAWSYDAVKYTAQLDNISVEFDTSLPVGRAILLIDDICDSGRTLRILNSKFREWGASEVRSAAIIRRVVKEEGYYPEYVGFNWEGEEWFVGYGMDLKQQWRNLPGIYTITN